MTETLILAEGTHAHTLKSPEKIEKIKFIKETPFNNFMFRINKESLVEHEVPQRGHSQTRVPHGTVVLKPGIYERSIAVEFNPLDLSLVENYD